MRAGKRIRIAIAVTVSLAFAGVTTPAATMGATGERGAALKKCNKKQGPSRQRCKTQALKLPV
jgi:hypothetical protein